MTLSRKIISTISVTLLLTGCSIPGSNINIDNKQVVATGSEDTALDNINVYPLFIYIAICTNYNI